MDSPLHVSSSYWKDFYLFFFPLHLISVTIFYKMIRHPFTFLRWGITLFTLLWHFIVIFTTCRPLNAPAFGRCIYWNLEEFDLIFTDDIIRHVWPGSDTLSDWGKYLIRSRRSEWNKRGKTVCKRNKELERGAKI